MNINRPGVRLFLSCRRDFGFARLHAFAAMAIAVVAACQHPSGTSPHKASSQPPASAAIALSAAPQESTIPNAPFKLERHDTAMGTSLFFVAYTNARVGAVEANLAIDRAIAEIRRLEGLLSEWKNDSEVSHINSQAGSWVTVGPETAEVISEALWVSRASEGTFDITFHGMGDLWKFGTAADTTPQVPNAAEVRKRRLLVDYRKVEFDREKSQVRIPQGRKIGLGGIAKGYIVDRAVDVLRRAGLEAFLVRAGGDLYAAGRKPDGTAWVSGIQNPRAPEGTYFASLELENHAFSTAGDYARAYVVDNKRYHHIIDPRTGYPATLSRSVTVYAPNAMTADMIDDAVFILGPEKGLKLASSLEDVGVVIVDANNKVWVSPLLDGKVSIHQAPWDGI